MKRFAVALLLSACTHEAPPAPPPAAPTPEPSESRPPPRDPKECITTLEGTPRIPWAIMFEKNSDALDANGDKGIEQIVAFRKLEGRKPAIVRFAAIGFAEPDETNPRELSERRAQRVIDALANRGIAAERMEAHGLATARDPSAERSSLPNRFVLFHTLFEYRGPAEYWAGDHLEECPSPRAKPAKPPVAACEPPPYYVGPCDDRRP